MEAHTYFLSCHQSEVAFLFVLSLGSCPTSRCHVCKKASQEMITNAHILGGVPALQCADKVLLHAICTHGRLRVQMLKHLEAESKRVYADADAEMLSHQSACSNADSPAGSVTPADAESDCHEPVCEHIRQGFHRSQQHCMHQSTKVLTSLCSSPQVCSHLYAAHPPMAIAAHKANLGCTIMMSSGRSARMKQY